MSRKMGNCCSEKKRAKPILLKTLFVGRQSAYGAKPKQAGNNTCDSNRL